MFPNPSFYVRLTIAIFLLLVASFGRSSSVRSATTTITTPTWQQRMVNEQTLLLTLTLPPPQMSLTAEGNSEISLAGFDKDTTAGEWALPLRQWLVGIPANARPTIRLLGQKSADYPHIVLSPNLAKITQYDSQDDGASPTFHEERVAMTTERTEHPVVMLGEKSWLRDMPIIPLIVRPVQYDAQNQQLRVIYQIEIALDFGTPINDTPSPATRPESAVFSQLLADQLLNYPQAQAWRTPPPTLAVTAASPCLGDHAYRLSVTESGMYAVTAAQLPNLPSNVALSSVRMCVGADEIAIELRDTNGNNRFDGSDQARFYGEGYASHETSVNTYWLSVGGNDGVRIGEVASITGGSVVTTSQRRQRLEENNRYYPEFPLNDSADKHDHWYDLLLAPNVANLPSASTKNWVVQDLANQNVKLHAYVTGFNIAEQHVVQLELNSWVSSPFSFTLDGRYNMPRLLSATTTAIANNGTNTLRVRAIGSSLHRLLLDWVEIEFEQSLVLRDGRLLIEQATSGAWFYRTSGAESAEIYDVSNPLRPRKVTGSSGGQFGLSEAEAIFPARYQLVTADGLRTPATIVQDTPSDLRSAGNSADYIIITDPTLSTPLAPLIAHRQAQGLRVRTVFVQDIFDEFGYGRYKTSALRDFLYYAYLHWNGGEVGQEGEPADYVLLAGDASHDHRNLLGKNGAGNLVPVYLRNSVDFFMGEAAADNQYVAFGSYPQAGTLPFFLLGRLPAKNSAELTTIIDKIIAYEQTPLTPSWQAKQLFVSDNPLQDTRQTGCALDPTHANFFGLLNTFITNNLLPFGQVAERLFFARCHEAEQPRPSYYYFNPSDVQSEFLHRLGQGVGIVNYTGHAGISFWADEKIVTVENVAQLNNGRKTPILLPMSCLEGQYHRFDLTSADSAGLSEALLKKANGGIIASYAPTGLSVVMPVTFGSKYPFLMYSTNFSVPKRNGSLLRSTSLATI